MRGMRITVEQMLRTLLGGVSEQERLYMSTPIETVFPLKLILFFFTLVFKGSSSFVMEFVTWA
jgi:hypothetical protein